MKNAILFFALFLITLSANAQLAGTKWKGKVNAPDPLNIMFSFKEKTVDFTTMSGMSVENCSYVIKADTITFKKLTGGSPCPANSVFTVQYAIKNDQLIFNVLNDDCEGRKNTFTKEPFLKIKE